MKAISAATLAIALSLVAPATFTACQSSPADQAVKTTQHIETLSKDLQVASDRIATTLTSLAKLQASADSALRPEYDIYVKEVNALNSSAASIKKDFEGVGKATTERFKSWEEGIVKLSNPDYQKRSRERLEESKKNYAEVAAKVSETNTKFDGLLSDLNDIKESLGFDLSKKGVETWSDEIDSSNKAGTELRGSFAKTIEGLEKLKDAMSAGSPPPAAATAEPAAKV